MAYSFLHLENHHNIKEDLGGLMERESHKQERVVLMSQMKELQKVLQALKVSVCCLHLALQDCGTCFFWLITGPYE